MWRSWGDRGQRRRRKGTEGRLWVVGWVEGSKENERPGRRTSSSFQQLRSRESGNRSAPSGHVEHAGHRHGPGGGVKKKERESTRGGSHDGRTVRRDNQPQTREVHGRLGAASAGQENGMFGVVCTPPKVRRDVRLSRLTTATRQRCLLPHLPVTISTHLRLL